jgi:hypothetical protein
LRSVRFPRCACASYTEASSHATSPGFSVSRHYEKITQWGRGTLRGAFESTLGLSGYVGIHFCFSLRSKVGPFASYVLPAPQVPTTSGKHTPGRRPVERHRRPAFGLHTKAAFISTRRRHLFLAGSHRRLAPLVVMCHMRDKWFVRKPRKRRSAQRPRWQLSNHPEISVLERVQEELHKGTQEPALPVISQLGRPIGPCSMPYWPANWRY